ncbi:MAG: SulP family inorganic anion transporter [Alphaproteobacteria bacterium]|nr:SulP family inorganic anion transporter [Alphaproteobacteria bacterium]MCB9699866.1 SulP family inorganic anion transporter [Alphaproteobacteria bacterium]
MPDSLSQNARHRRVEAGAWRLFPALGSLRAYSFSDARADLLAGLSVATMAVPQAMAYALVAGMPPEHGLYTAIVLTAVGAFFDSSRHLVNGPTNAISIAVLSALAFLPAEERLNAAAVLALMMGAMQVGIFALRLGDLTRYVSHSVIVGFTAGAGALLVLNQVKNLLGLHGMGDAHDHFVVRFWKTLSEGGEVHLPSLAVGVVTMVLLVVLRQAKRRIGWNLFPELLITVMAVSWGAAWLHVDGLALIGEIPSRLPSLALPHADAELVRDLAPSALALATLGLLEALSMAKVLSRQTHIRLDLNQQVLSEGMANTVGSVFQCFPGAGSLTRSAINHQAGSASQWSAIVSAVAVALIVLLFGSYARYIPKACLAGSLVVTAFRMVDFPSLRYHLRASSFDAGIVVVTALSAVLISVEFCVLIGVFLSFMLAVPRAGRMLLTEFVVTQERVIHERMPDEGVCSRILIFGLEGEMFFGAAANLEAHFEAILDRIEPGVRVVVLRLKRVRNPDAVCIHLLETFLHEVAARDAKVILCGVREDLEDALRRVELDIPADRIFSEQTVRNTSTLMAVKRAYELVGDDFCEHCPRRDPEARNDLYYMI